jgi:hypothetical protein
MESDGVFSGHAVIAMLPLLGVVLLVVSGFLNHQVAYYTQRDERHKEKQLEYYRNTASQLGVIMLGVGVSLFTFFYQQSFLERGRREAEVHALLGKLAVRISRAAPLLESVAEIDPVLDDGGPYRDPALGGSNGAVEATGAGLAKQVEAMRYLEREINLDEFAAMFFSSDFEASPLVNEIDYGLWFGMVKDEADLQYAAGQLRQDYADLNAVLGDREPAEIASDPGLARGVKREALDVLWDYSWFRDRSRRLVGRACWLLSHGPDFVSARPMQAVEAQADEHHAWLRRAREAYGPVSAAGRNCYGMLNAPEPS